MQIIRGPICDLDQDWRDDTGFFKEFILTPSRCFFFPPVMTDERNGYLKTETENRLSITAKCAVTVIVSVGVQEECDSTLH